MAIEIRPVADDREFRSFIECDAAAFAEDLAEEDLSLNLRFLELGRTAAAFEGAGLVGSSGNLSMELTVPGGAVLACAGVTWVGVLPSHRRRGILTAMMARLLDDALAHGEPIAALLASESSIYGRFGFGPATQVATYSLEKVHAGLRQPLPARGAIRLLDNGRAPAVLPAIQDRVRRTHAGGCSRSDGWWARHLADLPARRHGRSRLFHAVHDPDGGGPPDGFITWRVKQRWDGNPDHVAHVLEVQASDDAVRLALVEFVCHLDLVGRLELSACPVDEPLRWALAEPRRLMLTGAHDLLWVRILDVARCLQARTYGGGERLVLEVADGFRPASGGRFALDTSGGRVACSPTTEAPDLVLGVEELGALFLGGVSAVTLAAAQRLREATPGAVERAARLFATPTLPFGDTDF